MAKKIHQFIGVTANNNILAPVDEDGKIIQPYFPVTKLGIQGPIDVSFHINGGSEIKIGKYGIYELDLSNVNGQIFNLTFNDNGNLKEVIVNVIYESLEGGIII